MIIVLARFELQEGKEERAMDAIRNMVAEVKDEEPGCLMYSFTRGQVDAKEVYVYEMYADEAAFAHHRGTEHMKELQAAFADCLVRGTFNVELLREVAGFIRPEAAS